MGSIRKRGDGYRAEVRKQGYYKSQDGFQTKGAAKLWISTVESQLAQIRKLNKMPEQTLADAFVRYASEVSPTKKGARWEQIRLAKLGRSDLAQVRIGQVDATHIAKWRDLNLKTLAGASVAREMNLLRSVLEIARREWGWIDVNPAKDVKKPKPGRARSRRVPQHEIAAICSALGYDLTQTPRLKRQIIASAFLFAIETGMRKGELLGLTWRDINLRTRVAVLADTKNGESREVPLSLVAISILQMLGEQIAGDPVFNVQSGTFDALFRKAVRAANIVDLHFHDSRHEACTRLADKLTVLELAAVIGHRDLKSLMVYYNPTGADLAKKLV